MCSEPNRFHQKSFRFFGSPLTPDTPHSDSSFETVAKVGDIPDGEARAFEVGDKTVAVFFVDGVYSAINDMCPHMGASLAPGHMDRESETVACPWHAWRFNYRDGTWADCPRVKTDVYQVRIVDNHIQVSVAPIPAK